MVLKETGKSPLLQLTNNFHGQWWRLQVSNSIIAVSVTPSRVRSPFFPPILHTACQSDLYQTYTLFKSFNGFPLPSGKKFIFHIRAPVFLSTFLFSWDSINVPPVIIAYQHLTCSFVPLHMLLSLPTLAHPSKLLKVLPWPFSVWVSFILLHSYYILCLFWSYNLSYHITFINYFI